MSDPDCPVCHWGRIGCRDENSGCRLAKKTTAESLWRSAENQPTKESTMNATHTYTATADIDGDEGCNPFTGLRVTIVTAIEPGRMGHDSIVVLHCSANELAKRYQRAATAKRQFEVVAGLHYDVEATYTEDEVREWHRARDYFGCDHLHDDLAAEVSTHDLQPIRQNQTKH